ncbi:MAG: bifunctional phosphoglucose/phosphomannose isomerase, partial [Flavobacteriia bacterium]|nr:bifunctional phosphoglucose/phosphomannose isomerase [Flavobacteriia bacterium]
MKQLIESFPRQIQEALEIADNATFKKSDTRIENVVICGLGGSGIGAKIVANWVQSEMKLPVI